MGGGISGILSSTNPHMIDGDFNRKELIDELGLAGFTKLSKLKKGELVDMTVKKRKTVNFSNQARINVSTQPPEGATEQKNQEITASLLRVPRPFPTTPSQKMSPGSRRRL